MQQQKRITLNKRNSIANINSGKDHDARYSLHGDRRYLEKYQSTSNVNLIANSTDDNYFVEEMSEIELQQSASLHYNSVIEELKAKSSPSRMNA